ncbi:glycosyltransferase family 2 protein [Kineococcus sp. LSe6-4]|uniref:Glycosyltransferase family 2 protein n=1 Tax=Kineococcus halophytocola TaxID=3234027 RepID=A0ABV4H6B8_9ACTN
MSAPDLPTVTVIVPVHNGVDLLRGCLASLRAQTYPAELVDVVVVDNNSTEDVASALPAGDSRFRLLSETRKGSYAARNKGLESATGEVIAFTDADCSPHPDWLERGVAALSAAPRADMVAGAIALRFEHGAARTGPEVYEEQHSFKQDWYLAERKFGATANVLTWRATLDRVGVFDASLQSRGDAQWGQRVAAAGLRQRYAADAVVDHPARASLSEIISKQVRVARGHVDVDLVDDPRIRHFAGVGASHLKLALSTPVTIWRRPPTPDRLRTVRYLGVFTAIRAIYVGQSARGVATVAWGARPGRRVRRT